MNRREFLLGSLGKLLPQSQEPPVTQKQIDELEASIANMGNASFLRDEALLHLDHSELGITYYGTILRDYARDVEDKKE